MNRNMFYAAVLAVLLVTLGVFAPHAMALSPSDPGTPEVVFAADAFLDDGVHGSWSMTTTAPFTVAVQLYAFGNASQQITVTLPYISGQFEMLAMGTLAADGGSLLGNWSVYGTTAQWVGTMPCRGGASCIYGGNDFVYLYLRPLHGGVWHFTPTVRTASGFVFPSPLQPLTLTVASPAPTELLQDVTIEGPSSAYVNESARYTFTAEIINGTGTTPVLWHVSGNPLVYTTTHPTLTYSFVWESWGSQTITVSAQLSGTNRVIEAVKYVGVAMRPYQISLNYPETVGVGQLVAFTGVVSNFVNCTNFLHIWEFDDGTTSYLTYMPTVSYTFVNVGMHDVRMHTSARCYNQNVTLDTWADVNVVPMYRSYLPTVSH